MAASILDSGKTFQEKLWSGQFGDKYTERNQSKALYTAGVVLYSKILSSTYNIKSVMEFGANTGINIRVMQTILPEAGYSALEINPKAATELKKIPGLKVYNQSIFDFKPDKKRDFVFTRGLLIHLNPDLLLKAYSAIYRSAKKYICLAEYYNPSPVRVNYRNLDDVLFKRDFAGEMMDHYKDLHLVDYGFCYHRDNNFPQDDISWFLMEIHK